MLADDQEHLSRRFAARIADKFEGLDYRLSDTGLPVLADVVAWIECTLHAVHEAGDHFIVLGRVDSMDIARDSHPLLFVRGKYGQFSPFPPTILD